jgi:uncharacterized protein YqfA (UPF0365 family)
VTWPTLALLAADPPAKTPLGSQTVILIVAGIAVLIFLVFLFIFFSFIRLWIQALLTRADISIFNLIGRKLRNVD